MRVLISGGSSAWGVATAKYLVGKGHEVISLVHTPSKQEKVARVGAKPMLTNLNDPGAFEVAKGMDAIVHAAQRPLIGSKLSDEVLATVAAEDKAWTLGLLRAGAGSAKVFVYASGCWAYGDTGDRMLDETANSLPWKIAIHKVEHEKLVAEEAKKLGYPSAVSIRSGSIYGQDVISFDNILTPAMKAKKIKWVGSGNQWSSFVQANDLGVATGLVVEKQPGYMTLNVVDDEPVRMRECMSYLASLFRAPEPGGVPKFVVKFFAGAIAEALAGNTRVSNALAKKTLGWAPVYPTYREGFKSLAEELRGSPRH